MSSYPFVTEVDHSISAMAGGSSSSFGTGGMSSKVRAARAMMAAGIPTVICEGRRPNVLCEVASGASVGTRFQPPADGAHAHGRKLWIGLAEVVRGTLRLDEGATSAVVERGASILPVGVTHVDGAFASGEVVNVTNPEGELIGRGVVRYSSDDMQRVRGPRLTSSPVSSATRRRRSTATSPSSLTSGVLRLALNWPGRLHDRPRHRPVLREARLISAPPPGCSRDRFGDVVVANARDMARAREAGMSDGLLDRLMLDEGRVRSIASAMDEVAAQPDPLGRVVGGHVNAGRPAHPEGDGTPSASSP